MRSKCFISVLLSWQLYTILAQQKCYWPNGSSPTPGQVDLVNCYASQASTCCSKGDICMSNGLCFSGSIGLVCIMYSCCARQPSKILCEMRTDSNMKAYRGGCTEQNWNNTNACPLWCNDSKHAAYSAIFTCHPSRRF